jgi:predicted DNA-binding transcriptional regulator AlpA
MLYTFTNNSVSAHKKILFHEDQYIRQKEAAAFTSLSEASLEKFRWQDRGPEYRRIGRSIHYRVGDLIAFMEQHRVQPTSNKD